MSAEARKRISDAQKARWAKQKGEAPSRRLLRPTRSPVRRTEVVATLGKAPQSAEAEKCLAPRESGFLTRRKSAGRQRGKRPSLLQDMMHSTMNVVGVAALVAFVNAAIPSVQAPELAWPAAFAGLPASELAAQQHVVDFAGVRLKLTLPQSWEIQGSGPKGAWTALDLANGRRIEIAEPIPTDFNFIAPATAEQLAGSIKSLQANAPTGYVIEKSGLVKTGDRLWLWHESRIPTFDASTSALYQELLRRVPYRTARTWSLTTTPHSQLVRVYFAVLLPAETSAADINARTTGAGAVFQTLSARSRLTLKSDWPSLGTCHLQGSEGEVGEAVRDDCSPRLRVRDGVAENSAVLCRMKPAFQHR